MFNYLKHNASVNISYSLSQYVSQIRLKITRDGDLELFVNGQSQGIAAEAVYKLGRTRAHDLAMVYYPMLSLSFESAEAMITAGGNAHKVT